MTDSTANGERPRPEPQACSNELWAKIGELEAEIESYEAQVVLKEDMLRNMRLEAERRDAIVGALTEQVNYYLREGADRHGQIVALQQRVQALSALQEERAASERQQDALPEQPAELEAATISRSELARIHEELAAAQQQILNQQRVIERMQEDAERLRSSLSWRLTAPVRLLGSLVRRG